MEKSEVLTALAALAHETRLEIFRLLVRAGSDGVAAGALAEAVGTPPATLSFHLKELKHAGVISSRREGRSMLYAPEFERMRELLNFLTANCCQGTGC